MRLDWRDPMWLSMLAGVITFVVSITTFAAMKPKMVTKVNKKHKHVVNLFKLFVLSFIIGLLASIVVFLTMIKKDVVAAPTGPDIKDLSMTY